MPIGTDLILHESPDPEACKHDAAGLGKVVEEAARRYNTPLAFPLMDLTLEKSDLLQFLGVAPAQVERFHLAEPPLLATVAEVVRAADRPFSPRIAANVGAVRYIAECTGLVPVGMLIGPFSLMTRLVADPIAPVAMAGSGVSAEEEESIRLVERCLALAEATVMRSATAQIAAGARAMIVCEPAASAAYLSPRQLRAGSDILERFVLGPNRRLRDLMGRHDVDLIFHNCGELTTDMVRQFAQELRPAVMSLGSSRKLWEDAAVVPKDIVLFGNLPTKSFYSDTTMPLAEVRRLVGETLRNMSGCGHPHILGSECDVLHVPDAAATIRRKVSEMLSC
jgi:uroporphyrinogen-III decarboxylase